jgi:hypothetical protein
VMRFPHIRVRLEFKLADLWVGVFWRWTLGVRGSVERPRYFGHDALDIWVCLLPMFPTHVTLDW